MKKKIILLLLVILLIVATVAGVYIKLSDKGNEGRVLSVEQLSKDGEYVFPGTVWGASIEEVANSLPGSIEENKAITSSLPDVIYYNSVKPFMFEGKEAHISLEFKKEKLEIIKLNYKLDSEEHEWWDMLIAGATEAYGDADRISENELKVAKSKIYIWETDDTMLQITLMTGSSKTESVMVALSSKEAFK